jgi:hypothetical protein
MIGQTADAGDSFKKQASIPLAPCTSLKLAWKEIVQNTALKLAWKEIVHKYGSKTGLEGESTQI